MDGKDDWVMLVDICKKQNTIQFTIVNVSDKEDLNV